MTDRPLQPVEFDESHTPMGEKGFAVTVIETPEVVTTLAFTRWGMRVTTTNVRTQITASHLISGTEMEVFMDRARQLEAANPTGMWQRPPDRR